LLEHATIDPSVLVPKSVAETEPIGDIYTEHLGSVGMIDRDDNYYGMSMAVESPEYSFRNQVTPL